MVEPAEPSPRLLTVALRVKESPVSRVLSSTVGASTARSGAAVSVVAESLSDAGPVPSELMADTR